MNVKRTRPVRPNDSADAPATPPAAWMADWTRQQMAVAAAGAGAMLRGFEAMRRIGEETAQETSQRHLAVAEKLRGQTQPVELIAAQTELLRIDMEGAARYWQQVTATALEMNTEVLGCTAQLVDTEAVLAAAHGRLPQA